MSAGCGLPEDAGVPVGVDDPLPVDEEQPAVSMIDAPSSSAGAATLRSTPDLNTLSMVRALPIRDDIGASG